LYILFLLKMSDSSSDSKKVKETQVRAIINQALNDSGEKERLKELLRAKLVECGWRDEMKSYCREVIKNRGFDNVSVEELVAEVTPKGRSAVPAPIKAELLSRIRKFLSQTTQTTNTH